MKIIEIIVANEHQDRIKGLVDACHDLVIDHWQYIDEARGRVVTKILATEGHIQDIVDKFNTLLDKTTQRRLIITNVESSLPRIESETQTPKTEREALYEEARSNARLDWVFIAMVVLSTIVATIGLLENNVAVIIGAMVIAPLLSPNLALTVGSALGEFKLIASSLTTLIVGLMIAVGLSYLLGLFWPYSFEQTEILSRTEAHISTVILALASGGAAILSMTTKLSGSLVGVMVAVAILPPASVLGLMLGSGQHDLAVGAGLMLSINIVAINLAANVVMWLRGINPQKQKDKLKAKLSIYISILFWLVLLVLLVQLIKQL